MRSKGTGASPPTPWWKNASNWIAIGSVLVSVPSAYVAIREARKAGDALTTVQLKSGELKTLAETSKGHLKAATDQASEAKRLSDAAVETNKQNLRMANAAGMAADQLTALTKTAQDQRTALLRSSSAAEDLAATARQQSAFAASSYAESSRPRVIALPGFIAQDDGLRAHTILSMENLNPASPAAIWANFELTTTPVVFQRDAPACPQQIPLSTGVIGRTFTKEVFLKTDLTAEEKSAIQAGKMKFLLLGQICYLHRGHVYRTQVCRLGDFTKTQDCEWGNWVE